MPGDLTDDFEAGTDGQTIDPTAPVVEPAPAQPAPAGNKRVRPSRAKAADPAPAVTPVVDPAPAKGKRVTTADLPKRTFRCHVPADRTLPTIEVEAVTEGDAEKAYKDAAGIIQTPHPIAAALVEDAGHADGDQD